MRRPAVLLVIVSIMQVLEMMSFDKKGLFAGR